MAPLAAIHLFVLSLGSVDPAPAYSPEAAVAVARLVPGALPPAARWNPEWTPVVAAEVERRLAAEAELGEQALSWHRYLAPRPVPEFAGDAGSSALAHVVGVAPRRAVAAADALRSAFTSGDPNAMAAGIADLSIAFADLADPFLVTGHDGPEVAGARLGFCDRLDAAQLSDLDPHLATSGDALEGALTLAAQSAELRRHVEDAVRSRHDERIRTLRRERLEAALSWARSVTAAAWSAANPGVTDTTRVSSRALALWPNPSRPGPARVSFVLPRRAETRIDVIDLAGRRIWSESLGSRPPGEQGALIPARVVDGLEPGVYLVRVFAPGWSAQTRWVRLRNG